MNNSIFPVANGSHSTAHTLPPAKAGLTLKAGVGLLAILCLTVFSAGCNTRTDKTTGKANSAAHSSQDQGEHGEGMGDDNQHRSNDDGGRDSMRTDMNHRGMGQKHREGMNN